MKFSGIYILVLLSLSFWFISCQKLDPIIDGPDPDYTIPMSELDVPPGFNWETTHKLSINITAQDNMNNPIPYSIVKVYDQHPEDGGQLIITGATDDYGHFSVNKNFPVYYDKLVFATEHIGLMDFVEVPIVSNTAGYAFGGRTAALKNNKPLLKDVNTELHYLGLFDSDGVPNYLSLPIDIIDAEYLSDLTVTLPKNRNINNYHPEFLSENYDHDLLLECPSTVWVIFIHEGSFYNNTLAFYTYDLSSPPVSANEIDTLTVIFPNTSARGSGGGLQPGYKVKIGDFPANTGIGWALISDGWESGYVTFGKNIFYSNKAFNPEANSTLKQHSILLQDMDRERFILAFEELPRDFSDIHHSDNDFNDCVFHITAEPFYCIDMNLPDIDYEPTDSDNDKIPDVFDVYPDDANYALNTFFPKENDYASLVYEDLWPGMGDFDFNDLVLNYNFNHITNANNKVTGIDIKIVVKAHGADFHNGFGIELPILSDQVAIVSGHQINQSYITLNGNGTESGSEKAIIILFDDTYNILEHPGIGTGVNTMTNVPYVLPDTLVISVELSGPQSSDLWSNPPYNPFLIINKTRGHEVHLANYPPTTLFDETLMGIAEDNSNPSLARYYKTSRNLPWAINIVTNFEYPYERDEITEVYLKFAEWVQSSGALYTDWFLDKEGYRNTSKIYRPAN